MGIGKSLVRGIRALGIVGGRRSRCSKRMAALHMKTPLSLSLSLSLQGISCLPEWGVTSSKPSLFAGFRQARVSEIFGDQFDAFEDFVVIRQGLV